LCPILGKEYIQDRIISYKKLEMWQTKKCSPDGEQYAGDGIRTRERLRDRALNPAPLTWLGNPRPIWVCRSAFCRTDPDLLLRLYASSASFESKSSALFLISSEALATRSLAGMLPQLSM
jgi:hypothetical protein